MDNIESTQQPQAPKRNYLLVFFVVLVVIAVAELFLILQKSGGLPSAATIEENEVVEESTEMGIGEGVMSLGSDIQEATVGKPIKFVVKLDSNKRGVVGMDAVLSFDKAVFSAGPVDSSLKGFTAVSSTRKNYLEVTSSKDPQTVEIPVLANEDVFSFMLTPKKAGVYKVELLGKADKSSTKFIDAETAIYLPKVNSVTVTVK